MRYLVMRRTMTGTWEDCIEPFEPDGLVAENPEQAQERVGDGPGVYRVIALGSGDDPSPVSYVNVQATVSRSVVAEPPPLDPDSPDVTAARRLQSLRPGVQQLPGQTQQRGPQLVDLPS